MGYRSHISNENITITDVEGLKQWLNEKDNLTEKEHSYNYIKEACIKHLTPKGEDEFYGLIAGEYEEFFNFMDDWKIVSYWYKDCCQFFKEIALYIEGNVRFDGEDGEQCANIEFEEGICKISCGNMEYNDYTPENIGDGKLTPIPKERWEEFEKKRILLQM